MGRIIEWTLFLALLFSGCFIKPVKVGKKNNLISFLEKYRWIIICIISITATAYSSFSPFSVKAPSADSAVFAYIGKGMALGKIPYKDMFDHKGILLYFYEYLGCLITSKSFIGIWIVELVNMLVTVWLMYKIAETATKNEVIKLLALILTLFLSANKVWQGGNLVEEYALPFITYAIYVGNRFLNEQIISKKKSFFLGLSMAAVAMLRINMISVWVVFCPIIVFSIGFKKRWREMFLFVGWFVCGMLALLVPTLIYTISTNCLKDFIEQYFIFNFAYVDKRRTFINVLLANVYYIRTFAEVVIALLISIMPKRKNKLFWLNNLLLVLSLMLSTISGRAYLHYAIILIPVFLTLYVMAIETIYDLVDKLKIELPIKICKVVFCCIFLGLMAVPINNNIKDTGKKVGSDEYVTWMKENTKETDDVLILGNRCVSYLVSNRDTKNKYFYQRPIMDINDKIYEDFLLELEKKPSDYIIYVTDEEKCKINDVVNKLNAETDTGKYNREDHGSFLVFSLNK